MTLENKKELVRLLHLYMADIMRYDGVNRCEDKYKMFDHARIIANKLEREISTDLFTNG